MKEVAALTAMKGGDQYSSIGDINVFVTCDGNNSDPQQIAKAVSDELERNFTGRGIQLGQL